MQYIYISKTYHMLLKIINESLSLFVALCVGIYAYAYMDRFTKLLFYQLVTWLLFFTLARVVTHYQVTHHIQQNDQLVFNIHMIIEALLLILAARFYFNDPFKKKLSIILYVFFSIIWLLQVILCNSVIKFLNFAIAAEALAVTVLYVLILHDYFALSPLTWKTSPVVWASTGLIIFFACNVPYMSLFNYLNEHYLPLSAKLFNFITDVLANIRYLFCAFAFFMVRKNKLIVST